jgi:hypothetical protein
MRKQLLKVFAMLSLVAVLAGVPVAARPVNQIKVNIPFEFTAGNQTLPAGDYTVNRSYASAGIYVIQSANYRHTATVQTIDKQAQHGQTNARLVFRRYGDQSFLAQIWGGGNDNGCELAKLSKERKLIKSNSQHIAENGLEPTMVVILAQ